MSETAARERAAMFARLHASQRESGLRTAHRIHVPGRIEVLGKHTDYAGGRSLLAAVERGFCVAVAPREDALVRLVDVGRGSEVTIPFHDSMEVNSPHWAIYPAAAVRRLVRDFEAPLCGADVALLSDLPSSSGLSSSSALLIATFEALRLVNRLDDRPDFKRALPGVLDVAAYLGSVESGRPFAAFAGEAGVGTAGGSQDHTAILASAAGRVSRFGFAPVRAEGRAPLPPDLTFVIAVSGVVARKTAGAREAYNRAAALAGALLDIWRTSTGRTDATLFEALAFAQDGGASLKAALRSAPSGFSPEDLEARLSQFAEESLVLVPAAFEALAAGDRQAFGSLVDRSQKGAELRLRNQVPETIALAALARSLGAQAASAFGAGFGGSVWALVPRADAEGFEGDWARAYRERFSHATPTFFRSDPGPPLMSLDGSDD